MPSGKITELKKLEMFNVLKKMYEDNCDFTLSPFRYDDNVDTIGSVISLGLIYNSRFESDLFTFLKRYYLSQQLNDKIVCILFQSMIIKGENSIPGILVNINKTF